MRVTVERFVEIGHRMFDAWVTVQPATEDDPACVTEVKLREGWRRMNQARRLTQREHDSLVNSVKRSEWDKAGRDWNMDLAI